MVQFGQLLEDVVGRVGEAAGVETTRGPELSGLFLDAPGSLIELQLRIGEPQPQLVLGFAAPACADQLVRVALSFAGEQTGAAAAGWRDSVKPRALDWGVKVPLTGVGCQLYARWQVECDDVVAVVRDTGGTIGAGAPAVRDVLTHARRTFAQMMGVELAGGAAPRHVVYVSTPSLYGRADELRARISRMVRTRLGSSEWPARWRAVGAALIRDVEEQVYLSFEPDREAGWLKIDVGQRSVEELAVTLSDLGVAGDASATLAILDRLDAPGLSHLGVRLRSDGTSEVTCYAHVFP